MWVGFSRCGGGQSVSGRNVIGQSDDWKKLTILCTSKVLNFWAFFLIRPNSQENLDEVSKICGKF